MLMMPRDLGLKLGPAAADAHDAPGFGSRRQGQQQLTLMMRPGLGPEV